MGKGCFLRETEAPDPRLGWEVVGGAGGGWQPPHQHQGPCGGFEAGKGVWGGFFPSGSHPLLLVFKSLTRESGG